MFANTKKLYAALVTAGAIAAAPMAQAATTFNFTEVGNPSGVSGFLTLNIGSSGTSWGDAQIQNFAIFGGTYQGVALSITKASASDGGLDYYNGAGTATWLPPPTKPFGAAGSLTAQESDQENQPIGGPVASWDQYDYKVILKDNTLVEEVSFTYCTILGCPSGSTVTQDFKQTTYNIEFAPVPIPAALPLFASALVGLGVISRRRKSA